jgi:Cu(I)/Ag(I) efflux system membrane protein CusA/SilA
VVLLAVPFSPSAPIWLLSLLGYNVSIAAWVGMIALLGLDAETGGFMLLFLDLSGTTRSSSAARCATSEIDEAIVHGAVKRAAEDDDRLRRRFMGLLPIMWSTSAGADVMKRIAAPMIGGLVTSFMMELLVYPPIYLLWRKGQLPGAAPAPGRGP